jgi:Integrase core domain
MSSRHETGSSSNGKFRAECLNAHWFMSLDDARRKMEARLKDYNEADHTVPLATERRYR